MYVIEGIARTQGETKLIRVARSFDINPFADPDFSAFVYR